MMPLPFNMNNILTPTLWTATKIKTLGLIKNLIRYLKKVKNKTVMTGGKKN